MRQEPVLFSERRTAVSTLAVTPRHSVKQDISAHDEPVTHQNTLVVTDPVTNLGNRALFECLFHDQPDWQSRENPVAALMLIDLTGLKRINDCHGYDAGDKCLATIAARLKHAFDDATLVARIDGDQFAIILPPPLTAQELDNCIQRVKRIAGAPLILRNRFLPIILSAGIATPQNPNYFDANMLFQQAEAALCDAKRDGTDFFRITGPSLLSGTGTPCASISQRTCEI